MINRFALSFLCIELDRDKICEVTLLYILLMFAVYIFVTEKPDFCFLYIFSGWCMLSKMHPSRYTQHISRQDKVEKCICLAVYLISNKLLSKL